MSPEAKFSPLTLEYVMLIINFTIFAFNMLELLTSEIYNSISHGKHKSTNLGFIIQKSSAVSFQFFQFHLYQFMENINILHNSK